MRGGSPLFREWGRTFRGEKIYQTVSGSWRGRTRIISASQKSELVTLFIFEGMGKVEVVDAYFEKVLLPAIPKGSVIIWDNASFHQSPTT
jgi:hypothetical protein